MTLASVNFARPPSLGKPFANMIDWPGSVGDSDGSESTGHRSGRRIVKIKRKNVDELTADDHDHMEKVVGYINRHCAQGPDGDVEHSDWRYSLMNWGHDPLKD